MFIVGYPQTPEPVIPPGRLAQIDLSCVDVLKNANQSINQSIIAIIGRNVDLQ